MSWRDTWKAEAAGGGGGGSANGGKPGENETLVLVPVPRSIVAGWLGVGADDDNKSVAGQAGRVDDGTKKRRRKQKKKKHKSDDGDAAQAASPRAPDVSQADLDRLLRDANNDAHIKEYKPRPSRLGLGALYLPHKTAISLDPLEKQIRKKLIGAGRGGGGGGTQRINNRSRVAAPAGRAAPGAATSTAAAAAAAAVGSSSDDDDDDDDDAAERRRRSKRKERRVGAKSKRAFDAAAFIQGEKLARKKSRRKGGKR